MSSAGAVVRQMTAVQVLAGPGIVARYGDVLVWMEAGEGGGGTVASDVLALVRSLADDGDVRQAGAQLAEVLRVDPKAVPALVLVAPTAEGIQAVVHGWGRVLAGDVEIDGGWADREISWTTTLAAGRGGDLLRVPEPGGVLDLRRGSTPGGGAAVALAAREPSRPVTSPPPSRPSFEVVDLHAGPSPRDPLPAGGRTEAAGPTVKGIVCSRGHFNNPVAVSCATCGTSMGQVSRILQDGIRPPLGALVVDDGTAYALDSDHLVGSAPGAEVAGGVARPVTLTDAGGRIAPVHAEIRLVGWDVQLVARGATFVLPRGTQQWTSVPSGQPTPLLRGSRVAVGQRTFAIG